MRFIQSLWIPPRTETDIWSGHDQSPDIWKLSNKLLNKHGDVEFFGCQKGLEFAARCKLQFSKTHELPEIFSNLGPKAWSLPKLYAASQQTSPFLHVDGDVFLYEWALKTLPAFLVQNGEPFHEEKSRAWFYGFSANLFREKVEKIDRFWNLSESSKWGIWNFGIFGGSAYAALASACEEVFAFGSNHWQQIQKAPNDIFTACVLEQILVPLILQSSGIQPTEYLRAWHLQEDARAKKFCHLIGPTKNFEWVKNRVKKRLLELEGHACIS